MTSLLEMKQRIKELYGRYEIYLLPILKFVLALVYFQWINNTLGFSLALTNIFVVLILSLLCAILPMAFTIVIGFVLMIGHCYALGIETAGFALVLVILMYILFLRFSSGANMAMLFTPVGFVFHIPAVVPLGSGLLGSPLTAAPAACGVIIYYFVQSVSSQAATLQSEDTEITQKLKMILDGIVRNQEMWVTIVAFVVVILLVYLLRTRSMDYAWRISVVVGTITYVFIMLVSGIFLNIEISMVPLIISAVAALIVGMILEFFAFGGDYSRTEHLEYEDDDYYYYVKAVPKASVSTSARKIKKINGTPRNTAASVTEEIPPLGDEISMPREVEIPEDIPVADEIVTPDVEIDFEKKLEESLKDL